jgi:hypothetical protein
VALVIFILVTYLNFDSDKTTIDVNATQVESVTQEIEALVENNISDINSSASDTNESTVIEDEKEATDTNVAEAPTVEPVVLPTQESANINDSLKIITNKKLWFGYIELDTENKNQKVFTGELDLDANKNWLLLFGHNNVEIELNGEIQKFEKSKNIQFLYKNGVLTQISLDEFQKLNKGNKW